MKSLERLLESWSNEFAARVDRVRALIGGAHWLTDGMHKERLLQAFIAARLPSTVVAGHGFLLDSAVDRCSREIDVLIRDCQHSVPFLDESGITICHPQAVRAYLEVKSELNAATLEAALSLVADTQDLVCSSTDEAYIWRGICFTSESSQRTDESLLKTLHEKLSSAIACEDPTSSRPLNRLPTCIFCLDRFVAFSRPDPRSQRCRLRYFPTRHLSFAVAIADMLSHIYSRTGIRSFQPLDDGIEQVVDVAPTIIEL